MRIWPAIDLRGGKCVRLQQGDFRRETIFGDDPAEMAARWVSQGAQGLHLVDLDGARSGAQDNLASIASILRAVNVPAQVGGGIRDEAAIERLLALGVSRLVVGSRALREPAWLIAQAQRYPQRLVLGLDARDGLVATDGWLETSSVRAPELAAQFSAAPLAAIVYTDIAQDGMLAGPNLRALVEMAAAVPHPVVASGGVTTVEDVAALSAAGIPECIIGRALYEGRLSLPDALAAARGPAGERTQRV